MTEATAEYERESDLLGGVHRTKPASLGADRRDQSRRKLYEPLLQRGLSNNRLTKRETADQHSMFGRKMTERFGKVKTGNGHRSVPCITGSRLPRKRLDDG